MNHKQRSILDYFLTYLPGAVVTLQVEDQQYHFNVFLPGEQITHLILFARDVFEHHSLQVLFGWMRQNALIETLELAVTAQTFTFQEGGMTIGMLSGNSNGCGPA